MVEYPSQGGYFFKWDGTTKSFHHGDPLGFAGWNPSNPNPSLWNSILNETCPFGYRRPQDGAPTGVNPLGHVSNSEVRQSLWWNPVDGAGVGNSNNLAWGYYADGFFDRREIVDAIHAGGVPDLDYGLKSSVYGNVRDPRAAHIGNLFFNPYNRASLFFPSPGFRGDMYGNLLFSGVHSIYQTSSVPHLATPTLRWAIHMDAGYNILSVASSKHEGASIRCIACDPITSVGLSASSPSVIIPEHIILTATALSKMWMTTEELHYKWESFYGGNWHEIGQTTTNTYRTPVLFAGANQYRVTITSGCNAMSGTTVVAGALPTQPEEEPTFSLI